MSETSLDVEEIKKRSIHGVFSLTGRRIILRGIALVASVFLARVLSREEFGIFAIVSFIVNFFAFFSDVGFAAALIQKKEEITVEDLRTTFTLQQILVTIVVLVIFFTAPFLVNTIYHTSLDNSGITLIRVLAISLFFASLKSVPSVILERKLQFNKLVIPEIVETLIFNITTVTLAWLGYGVWSFIIAILLRGIVGTIILYILAPWPIGFAIRKENFKSLYSFGLPYQLNGFIALIKDNVVPTFVAAFLGPRAVGDITWAQRFAYLPLEILNDIIRVTFPTFSRLQHDPALLKKAIEKTLYFIALLLYPLLFGFIALMPWVAQYIFSPANNPTKWASALPIFYLFTINTFWASISTTLTNALFAIGKSKVVLNMMIFWTILTWIFVPLFTYFYGSIGVGLANALIAFTSIIVIKIVQKHVPIKVISTIYLPLLASIIMAVAVRLFAINYINNIFWLISSVGLGVAIYALIIYLFAKDKVLTELKSVLQLRKISQT